MKAVNVCRFCGATPSDRPFPISRGKICGSQCQACSSRLSYLRHADARRQKAREIARADPEANRKRSADWYKRNQERARRGNCLRARLPYAKEANKAYRKDPIKRRAVLLAYALRHPEKIRARAAINQQVRIGKVKRGNCESCGAERAQAHHDDYSKPLDVRWLCAACHGKLSRRHA